MSQTVKTRAGQLIMVCHTTFAVNVRRRRGKTIHGNECRYARLSQWVHQVGTYEVMRQHERIRNGDGGGVKICQHCRPDKLATLVVDGT